MNFDMSLMFVLLPIFLKMDFKYQAKYSHTEAIYAIIAPYSVITRIIVDRSWWARVRAHTKQTNKSCMEANREKKKKKMVKSTGTKVENDKRTERQRALKIAHNFEFFVCRMGCSKHSFKWRRRRLCDTLLLLLLLLLMMMLLLLQQ